MIKIALKHWIYEMCIDVLFKNIGNNFLLGHEQNEFKVGDKFEYIFLKPNGFSQVASRMYNCTILRKINEFIVIKFSYGEQFSYKDNTIKGKIIECGTDICHVDTYRRIIS